MFRIPIFGQVPQPYIYESWNIERLAQRTNVLEGHTGRVGYVALFADGKQIVSSSDDKQSECGILRMPKL